MNVLLAFVRSLRPSRLLGVKDEAALPASLEDTLVDAGAFADARARAALRRETAALDAADLLRMDSDAG
jgi:hypothetical protein